MSFDSSENIRLKPEFQSDRRKKASAPGIWISIGNFNHNSAQLAAVVLMVM